MMAKMEAKKAREEGYKKRCERGRQRQTRGESRRRERCSGEARRRAASVEPLL